MSDLHVTDPTALTRLALDKETAGVYALLSERIKAIEETAATFRSDLKQVPTETDRAITSLTNVIDGKFALVNEKFNSVEEQFRLRDIAVKDASTQTALALSAALEAAKEAVGKQNTDSELAVSKMESMFTRQIEQQATQIATSVKSLETQISDLKERLAGQENRVQGVRTGHSDGREIWAIIAGAIFIALGLYNALKK